MHEQLLPLYIIGAAFALYTLKSAVVYLWDQSTRMSAQDAINYIHGEDTDAD